VLHTILLILIAVLLLAVFVPVGIALYQRLRTREDDEITLPSSPRPAPPPLPSTDRVRIDGVLAQAAQSPGPPKSEPTQLVALGNLQPTGEPQGTEMMRWHGMLLCTGGPLEGQRFIIEEEGFYIGRDPAQAKIVINDSRISKRHVQIIPRAGRVHAVDQNSSNGTFLGKAGGTRVSDIELKRGDIIVLADNAASFAYQV
jgi:FHA domain